MKKTTKEITTRASENYVKMILKYKEWIISVDRLTHYYVNTNHICKFLEKYITWMIGDTLAEIAKLDYFASGTKGYTQFDFCPGGFVSENVESWRDFGPTSFFAQEKQTNKWGLQAELFKEDIKILQSLAKDICGIRDFYHLEEMFLDDSYKEEDEEYIKSSLKELEESPVQIAKSLAEIVKIPVRDEEFFKKQDDEHEAFMNETLEYEESLLDG